jgi:signal transduction histidine kinase
MQPQHVGETVRRRFVSRGSEYAVAAVVVFALWGLEALSLAHPQVVTIAHTQAFNVAITTASLLVSLGAAYFVLTEFALYGRLTSLAIGTAFLLFGLAGFATGLLPLVEQWHMHPQLVPYAWAVQRILGAALLLWAPLVAEREVQVVRRWPLIAGASAATVVVATAVALWLASTPAFVAPHVAQQAIELPACVLFFGAGILFWVSPARAKVSWYFGLALALVVAGFAELQYAFHPYTSSIAQLGDLLRLVFYTGILLILGGEAGRAYRQLRWQARELSAIQSIMTVQSVQDITAVIDHAEQVVGRTFNASVRVLLSGRGDVTPEEGAQLGLLGLRGQPGAVHQGVQTLLLGNHDDSSGRAEVAVPLHTADRQFGWLVVERPRRVDFSSQDARLLRAFGVQVSVLLERSLLYEEVAAGAVIEERSRLAREIHDGLAQHLAFLKMRVSWLKRSPAALDVGQLIDIEGVLETALTEARTAITTLRAEPIGTSTAEAIASYAREFGEVSGLNVDVDVEEGVIEVGPKARVELMRVVQEALNNVRKHAHAENVLIHIESRNGGMEVAVHDDGAGFTLKSELQGHFGMDIMHERTESIGGELEVVSAPRRGTKVRVWVPVGDTAGPRSTTRTL